jgi:hypothetical protein
MKPSLFDTAATSGSSIRDIETDVRDRRARTLIGQGTDPSTALARASAEAAATTHRTRQLARRGRALLELVDAYDANIYCLLRDLADHLHVSLAYVDRTTIDAHLDRRLSEAEWAVISGQFAALDSDDHIGEQGRFRTVWIETILARAGVPGSGHTDDGEPAR